MAVEIAKGMGVIVKRPNASELIDIRNGKVNLENLLKTASNQIVEMKKAFEASNLPNKVNVDFVNKLLVKIRKEFYENK
jgi:hypothetical protein